MPVQEDIDYMNKMLEEPPDYDMKGYIKKYGLPNLSKGQHLTDEFKLPNHITFSNESIYSNEKTPGGVWKQVKGKWTYTPSKYVIDTHGIDKLIDYFKKFEPDAELILPK